MLLQRAMPFLTDGMKALMLSGDASITVAGTPTHARFLLQQTQVEELKVFVWGKRSPFSIVPFLFTATTHHFDVITAQDPLWRGLVAWVAALLSGSRLQLQVHTDLFSPSFSGVERRLATFLLSRADSVRVVMPRITDSLAPLSLRARVSVLPIYIDVDAIHKAPTFNFKKEYPQFEQVVLVAARLEPEKNVAEALRVTKQVLQVFPKAGLFVAGTGSERAALVRLAKELGIDSSTVFLGHRSDVFSLYKGADLVLQTSLYEGYGATIIEALEAGTAVVSTDVGLAREAGATVVPREELSQAVIDALRLRIKGVLQLRLLSEVEWAQAWKEAL